jgi:glycosyltransferase involved in cell wall biosynthesis
MRVALLTLTTEWGGTEGHAVELSRTLSGRGHKTAIVCLTERTHQLYRERGAENVKLAALFSPKDWWKMGFYDWVTLFSTQSWDVVVLIKGHFRAGSFKMDLAARRCFGNFLTVEQLQADSPPAKISRRYFGLIPGLGVWWYRHRFEGFLRSIGPEKVVCVSDAVRNQLIKIHHFPPRKLITVRNGIDIQRFRRDSGARENWRKRLGIPASALLFGAVGRFHRMKGYDALFSSFQNLLTVLPNRDVRLVLVGEGPEENDLRALAERIVPHGRIFFCPFCERPWEPLSAIDVFVMPSRNEGLPLALAEAMASGCCPIATDVGGIPEVINGPELGWLVPAGDVDAFTNAMRAAALRTPEQLAEMGALARARVMANFNAVTQFGALADIIESFVPAAQHGSPQTRCASAS